MLSPNILLIMDKLTASSFVVAVVFVLSLVSVAQFGTPSGEQIAKTTGQLQKHGIYRFNVTGQNTTVTSVRWAICSGGKRQKTGGQSILEIQLLKNGKEVKKATTPLLGGNNKLNPTRACKRNSPGEISFNLLADTVVINFKAVGAHISRANGNIEIKMSSVISPSPTPTPTPTPTKTPTPTQIPSVFPSPSNTTLRTLNATLKPMDFIQSNDFVQFNNSYFGSYDISTDGLQLGGPPRWADVIIKDSKNKSTIARERINEGYNKTFDKLNFGFSVKVKSIGRDSIGDAVVDLVISDLGYTITKTALGEIGDYRIYPTNVDRLGNTYFLVKDKAGNPLQFYRPYTTQLTDGILIGRGETKPFTFPQPPIRQPAKGFTVKLLNAVNDTNAITIANVVTAPL